MVIEPETGRGFHAPDVPPSDVFDQCVRCGLCLPTCPTYVETLVETSGPRGRIALIKAVSEDRLDLLSPGFVHQMSECLDCRACEAVCPSGVAYGRLLEPARTQIVRAQTPGRSSRERLGRRGARAQVLPTQRFARARCAQRHPTGARPARPRSARAAHLGSLLHAARPGVSSDGTRAGHRVSPRRMHHAGGVRRVERGDGARPQRRRCRRHRARRSGLLRRDCDSCRRNGARPGTGEAQHCRVRAQRRRRLRDQRRRLRLSAQGIR